MKTRILLIVTVALLLAACVYEPLPITPTPYPFGHPCNDPVVDCSNLTP